MHLSATRTPSMLPCWAAGYRHCTAVLISMRMGVQAYAERERAGAHKLIERRKLEAKIKDFIRSSISRMHAQRSAGQ